MKKPRLQLAFTSLTESEIQHIADSLDRETYDAVLARVSKPRAEGGYGLSISRSPLERLWARHTRLKKINAYIDRGEKLTLAQLDEINVGDAPASDEIHDAILTATSELVNSGDNTPAQLLQLQRLADFPARAELREQTALIQAERHQFARAREQRAQAAADRAQAKEERAQAAAERAAEMHTHKVAMDQFRQETATARLDLAQRSFELRASIFNGGATAAHSPNNQSGGTRSPSPTSFSRDATPAEIENQDATPDDPDADSEFIPFGPSPLPIEVMKENARHAALLLSGQIETHYTRDPENSLFAKICQYQAPRSPASLPATTKSTAQKNQPTNLKMELQKSEPEKIEPSALDQNPSTTSHQSPWPITNQIQNRQLP